MFIAFEVGKDQKRWYYLRKQSWTALWIKQVGREEKGAQRNKYQTMFTAPLDAMKRKLNLIVKGLSQSLVKSTASLFLRGWGWSDSKSSSADLSYLWCEVAAAQVQPRTSLGLPRNLKRRAEKH